MPGFVYILRGESGRYYIGSTHDVSARLRRHVSGNVHTTRRMGELTLVLKQEYDNIEEARVVERKLKKLKRKDYIDKMVNDGVIKIRP